MDSSYDRPSRFLAWARETFTAQVAMNPAERMMRFVEEAIELANACDVPRVTVERIVNRVYERSPGNIEQEAAQCQVTLELWAKVAKLDLERAATREFERVQAIPKEEWTRRHGAKVVLGIAR